MNSESNSIVLLFYKYVQLDNPESVRLAQLNICKKLNLKGRIIVANEGINATLSGKSEDIEEYINYMESQEQFKNIHWKKSVGRSKLDKLAELELSDQVSKNVRNLSNDEQSLEDFPKLSVKVRSEIVSAHLKSTDLNPNQVTGKYIYADELHCWFRSGKKFYIVDMRNDYEQLVGSFRNAIDSEFGNFRDLPTILEKIESLKDQTIVTVCTGGIRCEKASGFLVENGFSDIYQLYGGIVTYMEKYPNQDFLGKLYVFDKRIIMGFNTDSPDHITIGKCKKCSKDSENFVNCALPSCHKHFICCQNCYSQDSFFKGSPFCDKVCEIKMEDKMKAAVTSKINSKMNLEIISKANSEHKLKVIS